MTNLTFKNYYDIAALSPEDWSFLSPVNLPDWCSEAARWLLKSCSSHVGEIGPGKGELAYRVSQLASNNLHLVLIDTSSAMLNLTLKKIRSLQKPITVEHLNFDIDQEITNQLDSLSSQNLDKLIAVNVLQDLDPSRSLVNMRSLLRLGGEIRLTFISKETQDEFLEEDLNYDCSQGIWYVPSSFHYEKGAIPLGFIKNKPFYRIITCYTQQKACQLLQNAGFEVKSVESITYPTDYLWKRWKSRYHSIRLTERQLKLLDYWGGYPDGWDIIAIAT